MRRSGWLLALLLGVSACTGTPAGDRATIPPPTVEEPEAVVSFPPVATIRLESPRRGPVATLRLGSASIRGFPESYTWRRGPGSLVIRAVAPPALEPLPVPAGAVLHVEGLVHDLSGTLAYRPIHGVEYAGMRFVDGVTTLSAEPGRRWYLGLTGTLPRGRVTLWFPIRVTDPVPATPAARLEIELFRGQAARPLPDGPPEPGVVYRFEASHCGLSFGARFDGSLWHPVPPADRPGLPSPFINSDRGSLVLAEPDWAVYLSSGGLVILLVRHHGPTVPEFCE